MKKMKISWGTAIVLAFAGFITFILSFVVRMNTQKKYDHEMVTEAYYAKELSFQQDMDRELRTLRLGMAPKVERGEDGIYIYFPEQANPEGIRGIVSLYRPSESREDFTIPLELTGNSLEIPGYKLLRGRWNLEIDWRYNGDHYLSREKIMY